jgi:hypothetical protein
LASKEKEAQERAEAISKKQSQRREQAAEESEAQAAAVRENTARLKSLRLAKKAPDETANADQRPADKAIPVEQLNASNDE